MNYETESIFRNIQKYMCRASIDTMLMETYNKEETQARYMREMVYRISEEAVKKATWETESNRMRGTLEVTCTAYLFSEDELKELINQAFSAGLNQMSIDFSSMPSIPEKQPKAKPEAKTIQLDFKRSFNFGDRDES